MATKNTDVRKDETMTVQEVEFGGLCRIIEYHRTRALAVVNGQFSQGIERSHRQRAVHSGNLVEPVDKHRTSLYVFLIRAHHIAARGVQRGFSNNLAD